jgi:hypothetical protein
MAKTTQRKLYRTMQGKMVDIDKLRAANEEVKAVGNMNVNARGDVVQGEQLIQSKEAVMKQYYEQPKGVVSDAPVKKIAQPKPIPQAEVVETKVMNPTKATSSSQPVQGIKNVKKINTFKPKVEQKKTEEKSGIDAALDGIDD